MNSHQVGNIIKRQHYHTAIFKYGVIPVLFLLQKYEQQERYEQCAIIRDAIADQNEWINAKLPATLNGLDVEEFVKDAFAGFGLTGIGFWDRLPFYISEIERDVAACWGGKQ